jgi:hypothetical protein
LERLPGGLSTHWENAAFAQRTPGAVIHKQQQEWGSNIVQVCICLIDSTAETYGSAIISKELRQIER